MSSFWYTNYSGFVPNPQASFQDEFNRLAQSMKWKQGGRRYQKEWRQCVEGEFCAHFGQEVSRLDSWQALCTEVGIRDIPGSITGCKKALKGMWINIVDLIDARRTGKAVQRHRSLNALRQYIRETKKFYPKEAAKQNRFLSAFLITVYG